MEILFDLQNYLNNKPLGELSGDSVLCPYGDILPTLLIEQVEDVRVIRVTKRINNKSGIELRLHSMEGIDSGNRIVVVGRFGQSLVLHGAKIALFSAKESAEELASHEPYSNLYSLGCSISGLRSQSLFLSLCKTSASFSGVDFIVDGILVMSGDV